jgi:hypothetical protein
MAVGGGVGRNAKKTSRGKKSGGSVFTKGPSKKSTAPGGGGRFENCMASGKSRKLCAYIGRKAGKI